MKSLACPTCGAPVRAGESRALVACAYCNSLLDLSSGTAGAVPRADALGSQVRELLRTGEKMMAIKVYRESTRCSLLDAKNWVEAIEQTLKSGS